MKFYTRLFDLGYIPILLIITGCFLRFYRLDFQPLWIDELIDWSIINLPTLDSVIEKSSWTAQIPTGYIFYRFFINISSDSVFALRFLPALLSCLSLFYFAILVKKYFNQQTLLLSLCLFCFNPTLLWHAQEFRPYSALLCFSIMSAFHLLEWLERNQTSHYLMYTLSSLLMTQSHHFGLLFALLQPLSLLLFKNKILSPQITQYTLTVFLLVIFQIPWISEFMYYLFTDNSDIFHSQLSSSLSHAIIDYWTLIYKSHSHAFSQVMLVIVGLSLLNLLLIQRALRKREIQDQMVLLFLAWAIIPFILFFSSQSLIKEAGYPNRYLLFCVPFFIIAISHSLQKAFEIKYACPLICVCLIGFQAPTFVGEHSIYRTYNRINFPRLIQSIDLKSVQTVYVLGSPNSGLKYYFDKPQREKVKAVLSIDDLNELKKQINLDLAQAISLIFILNSNQHEDWTNELISLKNFETTYEDENYQVLVLSN